MSYRQAFFVFPAETKDNEIYDTIHFTVMEITGDASMTNTHLVLKQHHDSKYAMILGDIPSGGFVHRDAYFELISFEHDRVGFIGHDDSTGVYVFEYINKHTNTSNTVESIHLISNAHRIGGTLDKVTIDYPQKGFSPEELQAILRMKESDMSDAQYMAVAEYQNAVRIGLTQTFGHTGNYLSLCHEQRCYDLSDPSMTLVQRPESLSNVIAYWPTYEDQQRAGIFID